MKHGLFYALSLVLAKGIGLAMLPWIASHLSVAEFGQLELVGLWVTVGSVFVAFAMTEALYRYASPQASGIAHFLYQRVTWITWVSLVAVMVGFAVARSLGLPDAELWVLAGATMAVEGLISFPLAWMRMRDESALFMWTNLVKVVVQTALVVLAIRLDLGVLGIVFAGLLAAALQAFALSYWMHIQKCSALQPVSGWAKFCLPLMLSGLLSIALFGIERAFIGGLSGLESLGVYAVAAKFGLALALLMQPFGMWWFPKRTGLAQRNPTEFLKWSHSGIALLLLICAGTLLVTPRFIQWVFPSAYWPAIDYLLPVILAVAAKEWGELSNFGVWRQQPNQILRINLGSAVAGIALMLLAGWIWGGLGIVYALALSSLVRASFIQSAANRWCPDLRLRLEPWFLVPGCVAFSLLGQTDSIWPVAGSLLALGTVAGLMVLRQFKRKAVAA